MPGQDGQINVAILAVPEVTASALYSMFDLFSSPGRDFPFIVTGTAGEQRMRPYTVARTQDGFQAANGIWVKPDHISTASKPKTTKMSDSDSQNCVTRFRAETDHLADWQSG